MATHSVFFFWYVVAVAAISWCRLACNILPLVDTNARFSSLQLFQSTILINCCYLPSAFSFPFYIYFYFVCLNFFVRESKLLDLKFARHKNIWSENKCATHWCRSGCVVECLSRFDLFVYLHSKRQLYWNKTENKRPGQLTPSSMQHRWHLHDACA